MTTYGDLMSNAADLANLSRKEKLQLLEALEERARRDSRNKFATIFPDTGPLRRELYPKALEFFELGTTYNERAFIAGNRCGKTLTGCFELTCHLTGRYPKFWKGKRFAHPVRTWVAGDTSKSVRDILQAELLGPPGDESAQGTGMIPGDLILKTDVKHGLASAVDRVFVRHVDGGTSVVQFLSYDQGREVFQGTSQDVVLLDEECPESIYVECLTRTLTTGGIVMLTFTPLNGLTPLVLSFLPNLAPKVSDE